MAIGQESERVSKRSGNVDVSVRRLRLEALRWRRLLLGRRMWNCALNGFSAGIPLYYLYSFMPAFLRDNGVDLKTIGLFTLIGMPYSWKFLWAPLMDRYAFSFLGRRRGWIFCMQLLCALGMALAGICDVESQTHIIVACAACVAFFSASQDIVLDAYRRELLQEREFGMGNAWYVNGYRLAALVPGSLGLILADMLPWSVAHLTLAAIMASMTLYVMWAEEPEHIAGAPSTLREAVLRPISEFFSRGRFFDALMILAFLALYKLGDNMAFALATPFYLDMGYSKTIIGSLVKIVSLSSVIVGGVIGGVVLFRQGIDRSLWYFGVVQSLSILGFVALALASAPNNMLLAGVLAFENLGVGLGTVALTAFISRATDARFTASQFALLSSLIALPRMFAGASAGFLVEGVEGTFEGLGYVGFFVLCFLCSFPGLLLLPKVAPWSKGAKEMEDV